MPDTLHGESVAFNAHLCHAHGMDLMRSADVCQALGITNTTLLRWIKPPNPKLVPVQKFPGPNGPYLFNRRDVDRLAAELKQRKTS